MASCRKESAAPHSFTILYVDRIDRPGFNRCMARKGYQVSVEQ